MRGGSSERRRYVITLLYRAEDLIQQRGWCQGVPTSPDGGLCITRAIREAGFDGNWDDLGIPWPAAWNDVPGRTISEVYVWFYEQIVRLESKINN